jgi:signal transduction histidine kinase
VTRTRSFSLRLALTYVGIFLISTGLVAASYYFVSVHKPYVEIRDQVQREATQLAEVHAKSGEEALVEALVQRSHDRGASTAFHAYIDASGTTRLANLPSWPAAHGPRWLELQADLYADGVEFDRNALALDQMLPDGSRLIVGRDTENLDEITEMLGEALAWLAVTSLVIGVFGGFLLSKAIGRRLQTIADTALQVIHGDLEGRVPVDGSNDDFDRLSHTLNQMLDRIQVLFNSVRRVSDNIAHELRTPIARLLTHLETEVAEGSDHSPDLQLIAAEARRLQRIVDSLLRISRIEEGRHALHLRPIRPLTMLSDMAELYEPAVEELGGSITIASHGLDPAKVFHADRDLLFQALSNLIDNALKYAGTHPRIVLSAAYSDRALVLGVRDFGPGMAEGSINRATERFFRGDNAAFLPGEGLGLALVLAVVRAHNGKMILNLRQPGMEFTLKIPG